MNCHYYFIMAFFWQILISYFLTITFLKSVGSTDQNALVRCREPDDFFSRMRGTWRSQVPCILEKKSSGSLHRHCELGKKGLKCPRLPSWPSRRPRPSSRPFFTTDDLFWCLWHVLDVHGSLHGLFWRPKAFFDGWRPFLIAAQLSFINFRFNYIMQ